LVNTLRVVAERRVDPLERQASLLLYLLGTGGPRTRHDIAERVSGYPPDPESMRRQFERDKAALLDRDIPLRVAEHGDDWTYEIRAAEYYLSDLKLADDERLALELALSAVHIGGAPANDALRKVGADADVGHAPVAATLPDEAALPALFAARRQRAAVRFTYMGGDARHLDPWAVFFANGYWYVVGHDHDRDAQRVFRVDRIEGGVEAVDAGTVVVPDDFDARDVIPEPWELPGDNPVIAEVRLDASVGAVIAERMAERATAEVADDGSVTLHFPVQNHGAFRSWLFGMLDHAVVLGPPELRAGVVDWLKAMAEA
jgi:predicted DNA-binding transcriptional regulator YafY